MRNFKREEKIFIQPINNNSFEVADRDGNVLLNAQDDYRIYFKNVNFKNGKIDGRYLGVATDTLIDAHCKQIDIQDGQFTVDGKVVRTARMVAINNKTGAVVVIESK